MQANLCYRLTPMGQNNTFKRQELSRLSSLKVLSKVAKATKQCINLLFPVVLSKKHTMVSAGTSNRIILCEYRIATCYRDKNFP